MLCRLNLDNLSSPSRSISSPLGKVARLSCFSYQPRDVFLAQQLYEWAIWESFTEVTINCQRTVHSHEDGGLTQ